MKCVLQLSDVMNSVIRLAVQGRLKYAQSGTNPVNELASRVFECFNCPTVSVYDVSRNV